MKIKQWLITVGLGILTVLLFIFKNKKKDPKKVKKIKEKAKLKLYKKLNKDDKKRKSIRDKYRTPIGILLIICLMSFQLQAEYKVYDKEEGRWYDYGHQTNYIRSLEAEKEFLIKARTNTIRMVTNIISEVIDEYEPSFFEKIDFYLGMIIGGLIMYLIKR